MVAVLLVITSEFFAYRACDRAETTTIVPAPLYDRAGGQNNIYLTKTKKYIFICFVLDLIIFIIISLSCLFIVFPYFC